MALSRGDVLGLEVFGHRHHWNGTICRDASSWDCGASTRFRNGECAAGSPKCNVRGLFDTSAPGLVMHKNQLGLSFGRGRPSSLTASHRGGGTGGSWAPTG